MKRMMTLVTVALMLIAPAYAQKRMLIDEFAAMVQPLQEKAYNRGEGKNYTAQLEALQQLVDLFENTEVDAGTMIIPQAQLREQASLYYYDMACYNALLGKKKLAVQQLHRAVDGGWSNYGNLKYDMEQGDLVSVARNPEVLDLLERTRQTQPLVKLQNAGAYTHENGDTLPEFSYQSMDDPNLREVREYFKLDSVAGNGDEISKIKKLLTYCHDLIVHDGSNYAFAELDAIDLYHYHKVTGKGINCRQMAVVMMEMYLSMGFKARLVSCMPMDSNDYDSHVINTVWSETLHKWLWIDPSFNAWVMDENGNMLSIAEVRERLRNDQPLVLNEDANHNHENQQTVDQYLKTYMAKNLYIITCPMKLMFNADSRYRQSGTPYMQLVPTGFEPYTHPEYTTRDADIFWAAPADVKH